ncbi:GTP-binding protein [Lederbergia citri]|uniref:Cobalamin biosynthesis protein n=1 Tax=Lederbergia citri TaxID=2833580 RepID=A0A942YHT4_9BACI|nr:GTP-binding protein [Lederbergia citri]MBS4197613.1 cobalamin biosynthesis protein [Lederbergia citri]
MKKIKLLLLSGFLGAGKTTLMLSAANHLRSKGLNVACVTNDQGQQLVDSKMVQHKQFPILEINGGCFCCRFEDLTDEINQIISENEPDVIIAEAVGSCTDIVATVIKPLKAFHGNRLQLAPLTVVVDPRRLGEMYQQTTNFAEEITYVFRKQLEEAQCLVLNKVDLMEEDDIAYLRKQLNKDFTGIPCVTLSAIKDDGASNWLNQVLHVSNSVDKSLIIDYDIYAQGEAKLGWLNTSMELYGNIKDAQSLVNTIMLELIKRFKEIDAEIAHLKLWAEDEKRSIKLSAVRNLDIPIFFDIHSNNWDSNKLELLINARINAETDHLKQIVEDTIHLVHKEFNLEVIIKEFDCFKPSRPVPTYRMA